MPTAQPSRKRHRRYLQVARRPCVLDAVIGEPSPEFATCVVHGAYHTLLSRIVNAEQAFRPAFFFQGLRLLPGMVARDGALAPRCLASSRLARALAKSYARLLVGQDHPSLRRPETAQKEVVMYAVSALTSLMQRRCGGCRA